MLYSGAPELGRRFSLGLKVDYFDSYPSTSPIEINMNSVNHFEGRLDFGLREEPDVDGRNPSLPVVIHFHGRLITVPDIFPGLFN